MRDEPLHAHKQTPAGPRYADGRFASRECLDPNCGGELQFDGHIWVCDGLTYLHEGGALEACAYEIGWNTL